MKIALFTAALFLLSYIVVNRGLGSDPLVAITSVIVVVGFVVSVSWLRTRGRQKSSRSKHKGAEESLRDSLAQHAPPHPSSSRDQGAKKLF